MQVQLDIDARPRHFILKTFAHFASRFFCLLVVETTNLVKVVSLRWVIWEYENS